MEQIKISLSEISEIASKIRNYNKQFDDILVEVYKNMNEINESWVSNTSETILNEFKTFSIKFVEESETLDAYADFLDYTVSIYDSLEATLNANALNFNE